ncbi:MAG: hypothetical protein U0V70_12825 [Terriglobia bacterium]
MSLPTRRSLLSQAATGVAAVFLHGSEQKFASAGQPGSGSEIFHIRALDRKYDCHRPKGCTLLAIEVSSWPGNEFGLWFPETIFFRIQPEPNPVDKVLWGNWFDNSHQDFQQDQIGQWRTERSFEFLRVSSTLTPDTANQCLWYRHTFLNTGNETLHALDTQTCFHLVNAPQFISLQGSRIWANLDGQWMTTDKVPRDQSPDPRRVTFLKKGLRSERTVVPSKGMPSALMPEAAHHPLIMAENFEGTACVGIASRDFEKLSNNNDSILRCLHSESAPIKQLEPGATAHQDSVLLFFQGNHAQLIDHYSTRIDPLWPRS